MGFVVDAEVELTLLLREPFVLVDRVVELGERVAELPAVDVGFEAAGDARILRVLLRERRDIHRVSGQEDRPVEQARDVFTVGFEHLGDDLAARPFFDVFRVHAVADGGLPGFLVVVDAVERDARRLDDGLGHVDLVPRRGHVKGLAAVGDDRRAVHRERALVDDLLHEVHHALEVAVRHVGFHRGEFRAVVAVHALVAEDLAQLVDAVQTADDEAL